MNKFNSLILHIIASMITLLLLNQNGLAQDLIKYYSGYQQYAHVIEVTDTEVVFKLTENDQDTAIIVDRGQVVYIQYADGRIDDLGKRKGIKLHPFIEKKIAYKQEVSLDALSIFLNHLEINYERRIKDKIGIEMGFGVIGVGSAATLRMYNYSDIYYSIGPTGEKEKFGYERITSREKGFLFKIGPKFMFRNKNSLAGFYFKPEFVFSRKHVHGTSYRRESITVEPRYDFSWEFLGSSAGVVCKLGYQHVFAQRLTIDINAGFGFVKDLSKLKTEGKFTNTGISYKYRSDNRYKDYQYNHLKIRGGKAVDGEIAVGFLF